MTTGNGTFWFELTAGFIMRSGIRQSLYMSKAKIEDAYPGCKVTVKEEPGMLSSDFRVEGKNLPNTQECKDWIEKWIKEVKEKCS